MSPTLYYGGRKRSRKVVKLCAGLRGIGKYAWHFDLRADHYAMVLAKSAIDLKNELGGRTQREGFFGEWRGVSGDANDRAG